MNLPSKFDRASLPDMNTLYSLGWQKQELAKFWLTSQVKRVGSLGISPLDPNLLRFLECSLIGDGSIVPNGKRCRYSLTNMNKVYIDWTKDQLWTMGVIAESTYFLHKKEDSGHKADHDWHVLYTRTNPAFVPIRDKWYPHGKKVMPLDFIWGLDALERVIADDGSRDGNRVVVYWGEKCDESFHLFKTWVEAQFECSVHKKHKTSGWPLSIVPDGRIKSLPGYEYKIP